MKKSKNTIVGVIYRHPHDNHNEFYNEMCSRVGKISVKYNLVLLGDLNIDVSRFDRSTNTKKYQDLVLSLGLRNLIL